MKNIFEESYLKLQEEIFVLTKPYAHLYEKQSPSKSRLQKCAKGLHEYKNNKCIYCEKILTEINKKLTKNGKNK